jgi:hypothetical protein
MGGSLVWMRGAARKARAVDFTPHHKAARCLKTSEVALSVPDQSLGSVFGRFSTGLSTFSVDNFRLSGECAAFG